jgi:FHA domain
VNENSDQKQPTESNEDYLRRTATRALGNTDFEESEPRWGTARFGSRMNLLLFVRGVKEPFVFDADATTELIIGRYDPDTEQSPDVDLEDYGAAEKGVSRRHASIIRRDGQLNLMDFGSDNGTYLNGQKLIPNQPRILRDGDDIRLGHLVLHAKYARLQDPRPE